MKMAGGEGGWNAGYIYIHTYIYFSVYIYIYCMDEKWVYVNICLYVDVFIYIYINMCKSILYIFYTYFHCFYISPAIYV